MTEWRPARREDWPGIQRCHCALEAKLGRSMDLPNLGDKAILVWMVAERDGAIVQFFYLEREIELVMGGEDAEAMALLRQSCEPLWDMARRAGVRFGHTQIPQEFKEHLSGTLGKFDFECVDERYSRWVKDLR